VVYQAAYVVYQAGLNVVDAVSQLHDVTCQIDVVKAHKGILIERHRLYQFGM